MNSLSKAVIHFTYLKFRQAKRAEKMQKNYFKLITQPLNELHSFIDFSNIMH